MAIEIIQRRMELYLDRDTVIVYEPNFRCKDSVVRERMRIGKRPSTDHFDFTWQSICLGEHLGSYKFDNQFAHLNFVDIIYDGDFEVVHEFRTGDAESKEYKTFNHPSDLKDGRDFSSLTKTIEQLFLDSKHKTSKGSVFKTVEFSSTEDFIKDFIQDS